MKLYRIGENELRISLSKEDLYEYSVTADDFDYENINGKRVIWELFDLAKEKTGFEVTKEKVYIQLYPKKNGGCELYITKLENDIHKECYSFHDIESFLSLLNLFPNTFQEAEIFRLKNSSCHYIILSKNKAPAEFSEYGIRLNTIPSNTYFKSQCKKIKFAEKH